MKLCLATGAAIAAFLVPAPSVLAGTATYNSTAALHVSDDSTSTSTITVPPGRTAIQAVEVANFRVDWPASGQEMSTQLVGPDGTSLFLFTEGCFTYDPQDVWVFSDGGAQTAPNDKNDAKCALPGGTFRPADPTLTKLSIFSGKPAAGTWTLRAVDNGAQFTNQGDIDSWAVRVVHAPPALTATAPAAGTVVNLSIRMTSDANGSVTVGGGAVPATVPLAANVSGQIAYSPTGAIRKKLKKKGKANVNVTLAFTDETGGTENANVTFTAKAKRKKSK